MTKMYVESTDLTSIANAIRAKTEGVTPLEFPGDFVSEIGGISGGFDVTDAKYFFLGGSRVDMMPQIFERFKNCPSFYQTWKQAFFTTSAQLSTTGIDFSQASTYQEAFCENGGLTSLDLSMMNRITGMSNFNSAFKGCSGLTRLAIGHFGAGVSDSNFSFYNTSALTELIILGTEGIFALTGDYATFNSGIASGTCQIYVPDTLVSSYKTATNWSRFSSPIHGLSEYPGTPWWDAANQ